MGVDFVRMCYEGGWVGKRFCYITKISGGKFFLLHFWGGLAFACYITYRWVGSTFVISCYRGG